MHSHASQRSHVTTMVTILSFVSVLRNGCYVRSLPEPHSCAARPATRRKHAGTYVVGR